eukprot:2886586-Amphidinium_carterae.1
MPMLGQASPRVAVSSASPSCNTLATAFWNSRCTQGVQHWQKWSAGSHWPRSRLHRSVREDIMGALLMLARATTRQNMRFDMAMRALLPTHGLLVTVQLSPREGRPFKTTPEP